MILRTLLRTAALPALLLTSQVHAGLPQLDVNDAESIKTVAATIAYDTMSYYNENQTGQTPGKLPGTWWEGGFLFNMLMNYWYYTGDTSYNPTVTQGMLWQAGENADYMPKNWTNWMGNDDQVFWGLAAISAAEMNFPEEKGQPSWLALAQGVLNTQAARWDLTSCGGGLRWQLWPYQGGYTLKNSVSNGGFFLLAARLAYFTGNDSYADLANKTWNWAAQTPLLNEQTWSVADSVQTVDNCSASGEGNLQWTYNYGTWFAGAGYLYNYTNGSALWETRNKALIDKTFGLFFPQTYGGNVMAEPACDQNMKCNRDQNCFKGLVSSWLLFNTYLVPSTAAEIVPKLQGSAEAAVKQCSGGGNGQQCGLRWWQASWDGTFGIEQEASVLSIVTAQMLGKSGGPPKTLRTGGTSKSDPGAAGGTGQKDPSQIYLRKITTADRAGAAILTLLVLCAILGGGAWIVWPSAT